MALLEDSTPAPLLYSELADWWPLLSTPEDYEEEAAIFRDALIGAGTRTVETLLELGCGGGNNASHLKRDFRMTLVDASQGMVDVSRALNPECEHHVGDMRTIRLDQSFDAVFVHDAIMYMTSEDDLRAVFRTAYDHLSPGGMALFVPDHVEETFVETTSEGGRDEASRGLRYLQWIWDPDVSDTTCYSEFAYLLRDASGVRCVHDRHTFGIFAKDTWLRLLSETGFRPDAVAYVLSDSGWKEPIMFLGVKQAQDA